MKDELAAKLTATEFDTADDKALFIRNLIGFAEHGFTLPRFTNKLYKRLSMCFGHIAHHDRYGFYNAWFSSAEARLEWMNRVASWRPYGDPRFTFCDAEFILKQWASTSPLRDRLRGLIDYQNEAVERAMFTSTRGQGFHVAFANGWRVSVQWGPGNYCQNKAMTDGEVEAAPFPGLQSTNAEVLVIRPNGTYERERGWQTPEEVAALLARVARRNVAGRKGTVVVA